MCNQDVDQYCRGANGTNLPLFLPLAGKYHQEQDITVIFKFFERLKCKCETRVFCRWKPSSAAYIGIAAIATMIRPTSSIICVVLVAYQFSTTVEKFKLAKLIITARYLCFASLKNKSFN